MAIELKYQDKVDQTLNVELDGEDKDKAIELMHKGIRMNKIDNEYAELKKQNATWNGLLDGAKEDDEKMEQLVGMIEGYIGRPLTKAEKLDLEDDDTTDIRESKVVQDLKKELTELKEKTDKFEKIQVGKEIDAAHARLSDFYKGKDGYPVYDSKAVEEYLQKHPIYTPDIVENYQLAYERMNAEAIDKAKKTQWVNSEKGRKETIRKSKTEAGDGVADTPPKDEIVKGMSWDEAANAILDDMKSKGESAVIDD